MSFGDLYTVQPGQGNPPGLPKVDLPRVETPPARRLSISVPPNRKSISDAFPEVSDAAAKPSGKPTESISDAFPEATETSLAAKPQQEVSGGEAFARSLAHGATAGLAPAAAGVMAAGDVGGGQSRDDLAQLVRGLIHLGYEHLIAPAMGVNPGGVSGLVTGDQSGPATQAYQKARGEQQAALEAGREQHPYLATGGEMLGSVMAPLPGMGAAAPAGALARAGRGLVQGGVGGTVFGAGSAISEGKGLGNIAGEGATSGAIGAALGGPLGAALGRRLPMAPTRGQRAAATAEGLGYPLPRGVVSDSPFVQASTAKMRQVPFAGERIGQGVERTQEAAGHRIGDIAGQMTGGATDRAAADAVVRPALRDMIDVNRQWVDANYNGVRSAIDQNARFSMPRTARALDAIVAGRRAAGWPNPEQGLDQFRNVAAGATFNGAHRARVDAREAGNVLVPHPGYNAADYNRITRAMTGDLREMVHAAARGTPRDKALALRAFDQAEREFGQIAEQNDILRRLGDARGEGAIATLLGATKKVGGNVQLLAQLHNGMDPASFHQIGGILLAELGHNNKTGQFSLAQFVTNWDKVSDRAKSILFSPAHQRNIEDIAEMGSHIKRALGESSTSHSASMLVLLDVAKDAALLGSDIASGGLGMGSAIGAGTTIGLWGIARWLGNPATASSMGAWSRAYRAATLGQPTPARIAAFKIATRNLANNIGVPAEQIMKRIAAPAVGVKAEDEKPK
jgi:hypothetical protein